MSYFIAYSWAVSSAVEHCFHTAGVTGSIPVPPTIQKRHTGAPSASLKAPIHLRILFSLPAGATIPDPHNSAVAL